jgi:hypothetical protein
MTGKIWKGLLRDISINDYDSHEGSFTVLMGKANRVDNLYTFQKSTN